MINKQKIWFLALFSLILVLSVYYITMPTELLATINDKSSEKKKVTSKVDITNKEDALTILQLELDEERASLVAEYNNSLTDKNKTEEEKNNAYNAIKEIDEIKSKEELLRNKIKDKLKLNSFVKIDGNNISVTIQKKDHSYSLANNIMRLVSEEFKDRVYVSVKIQK